jgi:futalosine hydrolase
MEREARPLRALLEREAPPFRAAIRITGAGKAAAALETALAIAEAAPALTVQLGCAGAFPSSGLSPGDVVIADVELLADEGAASAGGFLDLETLGLPTTLRGPRPLFNEIPVARPRFETWPALQALAAGRFLVRAGRLATVSTVTGTAERAGELERRWGPLAESMEGAAAALAAWRHGIPFLEVRGISNAVGLRDRGAWDIDLACAHAAEVAVLLAACELRALARGGA